jgi:hypothetical protein
MNTMRGQWLSTGVLLIAMTGWTTVAALAQTGGGAGDVPRATANRLERLIDTPGVTGREAQVRDVLAAMLPPWAKPRVDELGSPLARRVQPRR